jgi:hypothetical protein
MVYLPILKTLAVFAVLAAASIGLGAPLAVALRLRSDDRLERLTWEASLGLLLATSLLGGLGLVGGMHAGAIVGVTCLLAVVGLVRLKVLADVRRDEAGTLASESEPTSPWIVKLLFAGATIAAAASFLSASAPPTAGDALCYHLELPKRFLQDGGMTFRPFDDNVTFPLLAEMGFLWALAFEEPAAAALVHWGCGLLLAGAARCVARATLGAAWGGPVAAVVLLTPGINNEMTAPLNDVALALFATLAVAAWLDRTSLETSRRAVLVGLLLGGVAAVKYTGLVFIVAFAAGMLLAPLEIARPRVSFRTALLAVVAALLIGGPWYARAAWHRGDPFYPFLTQHAAEGAPATFPETKRPLGRGPTALLVAPWAMTMEPERFGGRAFQLGPLFLMCVPCAIALRAAAPIAGPLAIAAIYAVGCLILRQNVRFLLPIVPLLAVAVAACCQDLLRRPAGPRNTAFAAIAAIVVLQAAVPAARLRHTWTAVVGRESRADYLARVEPTYAVAEWLRAHLPADAALLSQEQRAFYIAQPTTRENIFRRATGYDRRLTEPAALAATLRPHGFTHLLTAEGEGSSAALYDATLSRLTAAAVASGSPDAPVLLHEWKTCDAVGTARTYRVFSLR